MDAEFQVMGRAGSTYPDTSATDPPVPVGPRHPSREAAQRWISSERLSSTSNREYDEEYWVEQVCGPAESIERQSRTD